MDWIITNSIMRNALYRIKKGDYLKSFAIKYIIAYSIYAIILFIVSYYIFISNIKDIFILVLLFLFEIYFLVVIRVNEILRDIRYLRRSTEDLYYRLGVLLDYNNSERNPIAEVQTKDGIFTVSTFCGIEQQDIGSEVIIFSSNKNGFEKPYKLDNMIAIIYKKFEKYEFTY